MQVSIDTLKNIKKILDDNVSILSVMVTNLGARKNKIKEEGWNDDHAKAFEEILTTIASTAKSAASIMTSLSSDIADLIKQVDEYQKVNFSQN